RRRVRFEDPAMRLTETRIPALALTQLFPGRRPRGVWSRSATDPPPRRSVSWRSSLSCPPGRCHEPKPDAPVRGVGVSIARPRRGTTRMSHEGTITHLIGKLKQGDRDAAQGLWQAYFQRLVSLARAQIRAPVGLADGEDVALSAFESFFRGVECG